MGRSTISGGLGHSFVRGGEGGGVGVSDAYLSDSRFSEWLERTHSKWEAYCVYCQKSFDISDMGVASLPSHASGKKHSEIQMQRSHNTGTTFFGNSRTGEVQETNKGNLERKENKVQKTLDSVTVPTSGLRVEVLWTLKSYIKSLLSQILSRIERAF